MVSSLVYLYSSPSIAHSTLSPSSLAAQATSLLRRASQAQQQHKHASSSPYSHSPASSSSSSSSLQIGPSSSRFSNNSSSYPSSRGPAPSETSSRNGDPLDYFVKQDRIGELLLIGLLRRWSWADWWSETRGTRAGRGRGWYTVRDGEGADGCWGWTELAVDSERLGSLLELCCCSFEAPPQHPERRLVAQTLCSDIAQWHSLGWCGRKSVMVCE
jgi:hypothetical protein